MAAPGRGMWGSRMGFVLAAAGSAVGLGNIWGFPTQVGRGGGAAFVLVYLACVFLVCAPILIAELAVGRRGRKDPAGSLDAIKPGPWKFVGLLGICAGVGILSFYAVIAGWTIAYIYFTVTGAVAGSPEAIGQFFGSFVANGPLTIGLTFVVLATTAAIIIGGVRDGIERITKALMPALLLLLLVLMARALTLPGAEAGLAYYLRPDFSRIFDMSIINAALGQAFFSLSLGMGAMITYGSYLGPRENIARAAAWVVLLDTSVALMAGFIIFPAGFTIPGFDPSASGPGLIFAVLPRLFATMPGGELFGAAFFIMLTMAALTSTISLLEVPTSYLIDSRGWTRQQAVLTLAGVTFLLSIPSALGNGATTFFSSVPGVGMAFLDLMATIWNNFALPIGGLLLSIFVGWVWKTDEALKELEAGGGMPGAALWAFLLRYVCPTAIAIIIFFTARDLLG